MKEEKKQTNPSYRTYRMIVKSGHYVYGGKPNTDVLIELVEDPAGTLTTLQGRIYQLSHHGVGHED